MNLTSNVSSTETLARASLKTYLPGSPGIETKRTVQRTAVYGTDALKIPPFRGGEGDVRVTLGLGDRSIFCPYSSVVGDTFTLSRGYHRRCDMEKHTHHGPALTALYGTR